MIQLVTGDIVKAEADALVNTVNCVGFMGRGIALQFKRAFPLNFTEYETACRHREVEPGRMLVHPTGYLTGPRYIINFPTKRHWRGKSRLEDIDAGLKSLISEVRRLGITSIAVPPLGCGLGGLDWRVVRPRIEAAFKAVPEVRVLLFEPAGAPEPQAMPRSTDTPNMTPGRATLVGLIAQYLAALMDPSVSLLEIHKLMYFMQEAGEPLRLRYVKAPYGPYAENLRQVLARIEGHLTSGYADGGDAPNKQIELVPGAMADASSFLAEHPATRARFDRVARLVDGFETPFGLELLASLHWVARHEGAASANAARASLYTWNDRKRRFDPNQIEVAWQALETGGWLTASEATARLPPRTKLGEAIG